METTIIILQIEEMRYLNLPEIYGGWVKELYDSYLEKLDKLNKIYFNKFILPSDNVGFCTEFALKGKNIELARIISIELYNFFKSYETDDITVTVNIVIGYGKVNKFTDRIHLSTGEPLIRVGRYLDKNRVDGIKILT